MTSTTTTDPFQRPEYQDLYNYIQLAFRNKRAVGQSATKMDGRSRPAHVVDANLIAIEILKSREKTFQFLLSLWEVKTDFIIQKILAIQKEI